MLEKKKIPVICIIIMFVLFCSVSLAPSYAEDDPKGSSKENIETKCRMKFSLSSWSVFYKRSKGQGVITCDNGQRRNVKISAHGGGISFGKSEIVNGHGSFTMVKDISELFGSYAASEAHAGAKKSSAAQAMTKGKISLTLAGTGEGYDLGFAFGSFKIKPVKR